MVELSAHNGLVVGSIPARPIMYKRSTLSSVEEQRTSNPQVVGSNPIGCRISQMPFVTTGYAATFIGKRKISVFNGTKNSL